MTERTPPLPSSVDPETRRAHQLDALAAVLPMDRRDRLAQLLTDDDVETLKHLAREGHGREHAAGPGLGPRLSRGMGRSRPTGAPLHWPAAEATLLKFVAHYLWDPAKREAQRKHGMPQNVAESLREDGLLRSEGPHAPATVRRRLSSWATLHRWRGIEGPFASPCPAAGAAAGGSGVGSSPSSEEAARGYARRAGPVLATCASDRLADTRDSRS